MNTKKEYQKPTMHTVELRHTQILAGSDGQQGQNYAPQYRGFDDDE